MDKILNIERNLVMGAATGYNFHQIAPFINTLRATGYRGDICFIIYRDNKKLINRLKQEKIKYLPIPNLDSGLISGIYKLRHNPRLQFIFEIFFFIIKLIWGNESDKSILLKGRVSAINLSIACSRYYYYYKFIKSCDYNKILVADTKDVLFQENPFNGLCDGIHYAIESKKVPIKDQPGNDKWVKKLFNQQEYAFLKDKYISCSGTTIGSKDEMLLYFKTMIKILSDKSTHIPGRYGYDQGAHNYIVWHKLVPNYHLVHNMEGFILTMVTTSESQFSKNEAGDLINLDGSTIAIIHQYNWFPNLKFKVLEL